MSSIQQDRFHILPADAADVPAVEGFARGARVKLLELNVCLVLDGNIRLFERAGFRIVEQRSHPGFALPTCHVMRKRLD